MNETPEIARIRAALEAWDNAGFYDHEAKASLDESCSPGPIRRLLAHIDAQAAEIKRLRKDAERYQKLTEYLASDRTDYDDLLVACSAKQSCDAVIDDMKDDAATKEAP